MAKRVDLRGAERLPAEVRSGLTAAVLQFNLDNPKQSSQRNVALSVGDGTVIGNFQKIALMRRLLFTVVSVLNIELTERKAPEEIRRPEKSLRDMSAKERRDRMIASAAGRVRAGGQRQVAPPPPNIIRRKQEAAEAAAAAQKAVEKATKPKRDRSKEPAAKAKAAKKKKR